MKKLISIIAVVLSLFLFSFCNSRSGERMRKYKASRDSIQLIKKDSIAFRKSLILSGKIYFESIKDNTTASNLNYGFVWTSDKSLSIVLFSDFPQEEVPVEIALKLRSLIKTYSMSSEHLFFTMDKGRVSMSIGKDLVLKDPLDESLRIIAVIQKESKWKITKTSWNDPNNK